MYIKNKVYNVHIDIYSCKYFVGLRLKLLQMNAKLSTFKNLIILQSSILYTCEYPHQ